jgi:dTDP-4-dehydrorhamnose reductase
MEPAYWVMGLIETWLEISSGLRSSDSSFRECIAVKILVIGRHGQLAQSLLETKLAPSIEILALGRPHLDVSRPGTIVEAVDKAAPHLVVNAAAYTAVDNAETEPAEASAVNAAGAGQVADVCRRLSIPLVHISTDYVFDGTKDAAYQETDPVSPIGAYGRTKLEGEQLVAAAMREHIILRTAWLTSPFGRNFVRTMLQLAVDRQEVRVVDDQIGSPTHGPHSCNASYATWCDVARYVFQQSARHGGPVANVVPITTSDYPTKARRPANSRLDCSKLERSFGIRLPDWRDGVSETVSRLCSQPATFTQGAQ